MPEIRTCTESYCGRPRAPRRSFCDIHATTCYDCGANTVVGRHPVQSRYNEERDACQSCWEDAATCVGCDAHVASNALYYVSGEAACAACMENETYYCADCDVRGWHTTLHICPRRSSLRSWDYRPARFVLHGVAPEDTTTATYGVELEVGVRGHFAGEMEDLGEDLIWAKRDGSVESADGFEGSELVSHPMSLDWFQGEGMRRWGNILGFVRENGGVNRTCGMHVHASGSSVTGREHMATLMYLWNTNEEAIRRFCRRVANRYARTLDHTQVLYTVDNPRYQDRYALVNLTNMQPGRSGTIEFRGFAATTDAQTFQASVEIVAASIEFTREFAGNVAGADWDVFGHWIFNHGETYPALAAEWLTREVYEAYRGVRQGLAGLSYEVMQMAQAAAADPAAPYGRTASGRPRQAPSEARRAAAARRYRDPVTGRLAVAPEGWTPEPVEVPVLEDNGVTIRIPMGTMNTNEMMTAVRQLQAEVRENLQWTPRPAPLAEGERVSVTTPQSERPRSGRIANGSPDSGYTIEWDDAPIRSREIVEDEWPSLRQEANRRLAEQSASYSLAAPVDPEMIRLAMGVTEPLRDRWQGEYESTEDYRRGGQCRCYECRQFRARNGIPESDPTGTLRSSGGWMAPSNTTYDLGVASGEILPEISIPRGSIRFEPQGEFQPVRISAPESFANWVASNMESVADEFDEDNMEDNGSQYLMGTEF